MQKGGQAALVPAAGCQVQAEVQRGAVPCSAGGGAAGSSRPRSRLAASPSPASCCGGTGAAPGALGGTDRGLQGPTRAGAFAPAPAPGCLPATLPARPRSIEVEARVRGIQRGVQELAAALGRGRHRRAARPQWGHVLGGAGGCVGVQQGRRGDGGVAQARGCRGGGGGQGRAWSAACWWWAWCGTQLLASGWHERASQAAGLERAGPERSKRGPQHAWPGQRL